MPDTAIADSTCEIPRLLEELNDLAGRVWFWLDQHQSEIQRAACTIAETIASVVEPVLRAMERPEVQDRLGGLVRNIASVGDAIMATESPGYAPYLESECSMNAMEARFHARILQHYGPLCAQELNHARRHVRPSVRQLAKARGRNARALAETLLGEQLAFVVGEAGRPDLELDFRRALERSCAGDATAADRAVEIARLIVIGLPRGGGRPVTPVSQTHELFLELLEDLGVRRRYTYRDADAVPDDPTKNPVNDAVTRATRVEFAAPGFRPQASARRVSAKLGKRRRVD